MKANQIRRAVKRHSQVAAVVVLADVIITVNQSMPDAYPAFLQINNRSLSALLHRHKRMFDGAQLTHRIRQFKNIP